MVLIACATSLRTVPVAALAIALLPLVPAAAQDEAMRAMARCSVDKNAVTRLACFDALTSKQKAEDPAHSTSTVSSWRVRTETSAVDDSRNVFVILTAQADINGWPNKTYRPELHIRCKEKRTEMYLVTGMAPTVEYGGDGATVTFRLDKQPAFKVTAGKSTDGEALFMPQPSALIKRLFGAETLLFQFIPFNSSGQMTTFDIRGLSDAIKPLREACKW